MKLKKRQNLGEQTASYIDRKKLKIHELIDDINKYNLPIDKNDYFVKKAEILMTKKII